MASMDGRRDQAEVTYRRLLRIESKLHRDAETLQEYLRGVSPSKRNSPKCRAKRSKLTYKENLLSHVKFELRKCANAFGSFHAKNAAAGDAGAPSARTANGEGHSQLDSQEVNETKRSRSSHTDGYKIVEEAEEIRDLVLVGDDDFDARDVTRKEARDREHNGVVTTLNCRRVDGVQTEISKETVKAREGKRKEDNEDGTDTHVAKKMKQPGSLPTLQEPELVNEREEPLEKSGGPASSSEGPSLTFHVDENMFDFEKLITYEMLKHAKYAKEQFNQYQRLSALLRPSFKALLLCLHPVARRAALQEIDPLLPPAQHLSGYRVKPAVARFSRMAREKLSGELQDTSEALSMPLLWGWLSGKEDGASSTASEDGAEK